MSVDPNRLRHLIWLATGEAAPAPEAQRLAGLLGVTEEILPYLLLRRNGFAASPAVQEALAAARSRAPAGPKTRRAAARADAVQHHAAAMEVRDAIRAVIEHDLAEQDLQARLDEALRRQALLDPQAGEPQLRIRR